MFPCFNRRDYLRTSAHASVPEMTMLGLNLSIVIGLGSSLFKASKEATDVIR